MATSIVLKHEDGRVKESFVGFSWTCFFFGPFVPLLRGDYVNALICFLLSMCFGIGNIVYAFIYNKMYTKNLIERFGYRIEGTDSQIMILKSKLGVHY